MISPFFKKTNEEIDPKRLSGMSKAGQLVRATVGSWIHDRLTLKPVGNLPPSSTSSPGWRELCFIPFLSSFPQFSIPALWRTFPLF